jgi:hypothetical protein
MTALLPIGDLSAIHLEYDPKKLPASNKKKSPPTATADPNAAAVDGSGLHVTKESKGTGMKGKKTRQPARKLKKEFKKDPTNPKERANQKDWRQYLMELSTQKPRIPTGVHDRWIKLAAKEAGIQACTEGSKQLIRDSLEAITLFVLYHANDTIRTSNPKRITLSTRAIDFVTRKFGNGRLADL